MKFLVQVIYVSEADERRERVFEIGGSKNRSRILGPSLASASLRRSVFTVTWRR
jgi:hypothetical protein